jgi:hypothetical protein|tara:strand:+ start:705 stop:1283 length:579 start_codon:yes stop_codon:yes gene_type:complete
MAIIYTYNTVIPEANDILLGTEKNATLRNPTKNFNIGEIAKFIIDSVNGTTLTLPLFFDVADPITGLVQTTLVDSIMTQDVNPNGTTLTIAGNISVTGTFADSTGATGTANQVLTSTVTGTAWALVSASTEIIPFNNVAVVTANHTGALGTFPSVTVVNPNNIVIFGEIKYITTTQLTITFTSAQTGNVYLN